MRVLIVETQEETRQTLGRVLEVFGRHEVVSAVSAAAGLGLLAQGERFDHIIAGHQLSGRMNGLEFFSAIRDLDEETPCTLLSNRSSVSENSEVQLDSLCRLMDVHFALMPYDTDELIASLGSHPCK